MLFLVSLFFLQLTIIGSISFPLEFNSQTKTNTIIGMIGSSLLPVHFCLDISSNYSMVFDVPGYNATNSSTLEITPQIENSFMLKGNVSTDLVYFPSESNINVAAFQLKTTFLYLGDNKPTIYLPLPIDLSTACLTLSLSPTSFLNQLYASSLISKKIIHLDLLKLYIGELEPAVKEILHKCPLLPLKTQWGCYVTGIGFKKFSYDNPANATNETHAGNISTLFSHYIETNTSLIGYFSTMTNEILMPMSYQMDFIENYFGRYFFKKNCKVVNFDKIKEGISCLKDTIEKLPSISFVFNDTFRAVLEPRKLFSKLRRVKPRRMLRIHFDKRLDRIIFGNGFIREFNLVLNKDEKYIGIAPMTSQVYSFNGKYLIVNEEIFYFTSNVWFYFCVFASIVILIGGIASLTYAWSKLRNINEKRNRSIDALLM